MSAMGRSDISLTQLRYFVRAAELESMSRAAEAMYVAQSAVSTAIANLERSIGVALFIRHRAKGLELTNAGRQFLEGTRRVMQALEAAVEEVDTRSLAGELTVGCFPTLVPFWMPSVCALLDAKHPDLHTHVEEVGDDALAETLRIGRLEVALAYRFHEPPPYLATTQVAEIEQHAIVGESHPLADREEVSLAELAASSPLVLLDLPGSGEYFQASLGRAADEVRVAHRFGSYEAVRAMVARGNGFSLLNQLPAHDETYDGHRVRALRLSDEQTPLRVECLYRAGQPLSRKAHAFVDACVEVGRTWAFGG